MGKLDEEILLFVKRNGPSTPIDIAQKMGVNSIIITAVLVDAMSQNKILRSKRKIGSSKYYFYPEHLSTLQRKIADGLNLKEKELLQKLLKENVVGEFELKPEDSKVLSELEDLIGAFVLDVNGTPVRCWYSPDMDEVKARNLAFQKLQEQFGVPKAPVSVPQLRPQDQKIIEQLEALPEKPAREIPKVPAHPEKAKAKIEKLDRFDKSKAKKAKGKKADQSVLALDTEMEKFKEEVYEWLEKNNIDVESEKKLKSDKEVELTAKVPTPFGKQTYIVRVISMGKKPATLENVSTIGTDAISRRIPVIIISASGFAKNAKKYWEKELQDLVFLMSKDDLD